MADYKYTQQSGTNWKVNTSDKADAYEDTNEIRAVVDELGELLGHSLKDGSFPEDLAYDGTLAYVKKSNFTSTGNPTTGDDSIDGYAVGSRWINTATDKEYVCLDSSSGTAVWEETTDDELAKWADAVTLSTGGNITFSSGGGQITFPASQNASTGVNTLDDYQEGAWTPALEFGGGSSGMSYTKQAGEYTKIGRQVVLTGYIHLSAKGSSTGVALITGLPFATKNVDGAYTSVSISLGNVSFANIFQGSLYKNESFIRLTECNEAGVESNLEESNFANNSFIIFNTIYFTD